MGSQRWESQLNLCYVLTEHLLVGRLRKSNKFATCDLEWRRNLYHTDHTLTQQYHSSSSPLSCGCLVKAKCSRQQKLCWFIPNNMFAERKLSRSVVSYPFATPWTVACQAPPTMRFFWARILEWVTISFSRGSSRPRDWTQVSHTAGTLFTVWASREAPMFAEQPCFYSFTGFTLGIVGSFLLYLNCSFLGHLIPAWSMKLILFVHR